MFMFMISVEGGPIERNLWEFVEIVCENTVSNSDHVTFHRVGSADQLDAYNVWLSTLMIKKSSYISCELFKSDFVVILHFNP